jgi:hypothetical protein
MMKAGKAEVRREEMKGQERIKDRIQREIKVGRSGGENWH